MPTLRATSKPCPAVDIVSLCRLRRRERGNSKGQAGASSQSYHRIVRSKSKTPFRPSCLPGDRFCIVMRHSSSGAPDFVARNLSLPVINAGDGAHEHPTQALLDALTIRDRRGTLEGLNVTILGDILHSRVARSNIHLLAKFGCRFTLCGPAMWLPRGDRKSTRLNSSHLGH